MRWSETYTEVLGCGIFFSIVFVFLFTTYSIWRQKKVARADENEDAFEEEYHSRACRNCDYDLRSSLSRCPECGTVNIDTRKYFERLRNEWPANYIQPRQPQGHERPEVLVSTASSPEANLLRDQLVARGIAASVSSSTVAGATFNRTVYFEVKVYSDDVESARAVLRRLQGLDEEFADRAQSPG